MAEVLYLHYLGNRKIQLNSEQTIQQFRGTLKAIQKEYPNLTRVSQACLINPDKISEYNTRNKSILLLNQEEIYVSRHYYNNIKEYLSDSSN